MKITAELIPDDKINIKVFYKDGSFEYKNAVAHSNWLANECLPRLEKEIKDIEEQQNIEIAKYQLVFQERQEELKAINMILPQLGIEKKSFLSKLVALFK